MDPDLPPTPKIDGEAMCLCIAQRSLARPSATIYGDGRRLACLGHKILEAAYTDVLNKRPTKKVNALQKDVEKWVEGYQWRDKVRHTLEVNLKTAEVTCMLSNSYVGAVFVGAGYKAVRDWIGALLDPQANPPQAPLPSE
ncbi:hypothetical protein C8Q77DRAFT_1039246, partial [Trametes polyzona]